VPAVSANAKLITSSSTARCLALLVGAAVLFNGIRVGEVTSLDLVADRPHDVHATVAVKEYTPVRADTKVTLDFQGLTGIPVVALEGGEDATAPKVDNALIAEKGAGESMTQAARNALRKVDNVLSENATPLHQAIANLSTFTDGLARNTPLATQRRRGPSSTI
jgi:phospholipid/cholesterol/gamma-HCH transport system substrate-binding protein